MWYHLPCGMHITIPQEGQRSAGTQGPSGQDQPQRAPAGGKPVLGEQVGEVGKVPPARELPDLDEWWLARGHRGLLLRCGPLRAALASAVYGEAPE
jgi:hypothetical protein